ncbi:glycosyltransferase family 2 protein [Kamptonema formosum]|uniref:glycosyltransferase family 2 protein n=1 Tax=Kamptonema formosum TaxID=331992 RepID=UPI000348AFE0|nr:glycosyltransferase family 2 protein [Oscillatoria sp. PCC 10802]
MVLLVDTVLFALALGLLVPSAVLFAECAAALLPAAGVQSDSAKEKPRVAVLVPAHNEEAAIRKTVETLQPELKAGDRLVAVADNCSDRTAEVAREAGAIVIERRDASRRGKGYALDCGLRFLEADPPAAVVVVDADCTVEPGAVERLARIAVAKGRPVQATYLLEVPPSPQARDLVSALAFLVKNLVRPRGLDRLGLPCLLTGTGMAFEPAVIRSTSLATGNIVEDMQLGLDLAVAGHPPVFAPEARVTGTLPKQEPAAKSQRTRWEHGHIETLLTQVPRLLKEAIRQKRFDLLALALDLCVPPLSLLVMLWGAGTAAAILAAVWGASPVPACLLAGSGMLIFLSIVTAWAFFGRAALPVRALAAVPLYLLWKIPLYLAFLVRRQTEWVRTERDT